MSDRIDVEGAGLAASLAGGVPGQREAASSVFAYWTFFYGGLVDAEPIEHMSHLVRQSPGGGTPGPTLCGLDRFDPDGPGGGWHRKARNMFGKVTPVCGVCVDAIPDLEVARD